MPYYRRQGHSPDEAGDDVIAPIVEGVENVGRTLRQMLPFPGSAEPLTRQGRTVVDDALGGVPGTAAPFADPKAAASIVAEAVSVLDEEMARGVLAARNANVPPGRRADAGSVLRQVHDAVDALARLFPELQGMTNRPVAPAEASGEVALPHVKPSSATRSGQRATVSMTLCNKEDRAVRLTPMTTDLIGSGGHRLSRDLLDFAPREVHLEPGASTDLQGHLVIPVGTPPGSYAGLVVVAGVDYLRALITIEVL
jgi:hypothetical protein